MQPLAYHDAPLMNSATSGSAVRPLAVLATVLPATFMQLVDVSIVNVAIPSIQRELGASYAEIQLVLAGYQLAFACVLITAARLGDILGRRRMFLTGMIGFTATSALCGAAPSPEVLVAARILQGLTSGIMYPQVISVIQVTFEPAERGRAFGLYGATIALATITGPLLGGMLIALDPLGTSWRSVFYVNVPIGVVAALAARRTLPESRSEQASRLDLPGAALVTVGLFLLIFPLTEGRESGWPPWIFAMLAGAAVTLTLFWLLQRYKTAGDRSPLIYTSLLGDVAYRRGVALAALLSSGLPSFFFVLTLYLQIGLGFSPLHAGLTTFPFAIGSGLGSLASDRLVRRFGLAALQVGCGILAAAMLVLRGVVLAAGAGATSWHLVGILLCSGLGLGMVISPMTNAILAGVRGREVGSASGVLSTGQQIGGALGVALVGVLFFAVLPGGAVEAAPAEERARAFASALGDTLFYPAAVFAGCAVLVGALARARRRAGDAPA